MSDHTTPELLTHLDTQGRLKMVDVGEKKPTQRIARAFGSITVGKEAFDMICSGGLAKGDAWAASRVAAIMAAKSTSSFIPLTHPIRLDSVSVDLFPWLEDRVGCMVAARATDRTGVEMEALVGVSTALLNVYDMVKGVSNAAKINQISLLTKTGGKSGDWKAEGVEVGRIEKLAVSKSKGTPKTPIDEIEIVSGFGLKGDAHGGDWHRQVSLLGLESIQKMQAKGLSVDFGSFAENVATSGVTLYELPIGSLLFTGNGVVLEVSQIGKECHTRCAVYHQAGDCVMPREGIFGKILSGGTVRTGDHLTAARVDVSHHG